MSACWLYCISTMCGITGYVGAREASEVILQGLHTLEYRGYDSAGVAAFANGTLAVVKAVGKVQNVEDKVRSLGTLDGAHCGIGHTRWATHGAPSDTNSHPHGNANIQIVHNGIIENYAPLRAMLQKNGYTFVSETDTEVAAKLIDYHYANCGNRTDALLAAMRDIVGSYAIAALFADQSDTLYAIRKDNPLIVGVGEGENFVASDIAAVLRYTKDYYQLGDSDDLAHTGFQIFNDLIDKYHPKAIVHGHVHQSYTHDFKRILQRGETLAINAFGHYIWDVDI